MPEREAKARLQKEFDRQIENLLQKGYAEAAGVATEAFRKQIEPLKERVGALAALEAAPPEARIPFVIVIKSDLVAPEAAMPRVEVRGAKGAVNMRPVEPKSFRPIEGLQIPDGLAYLLADIATGQATLNVRPADALTILINAARSPLTIDEGVALVTHFPEVLTDKACYNCFSMLGSRRGDQRVPALWISYGKPRLGWCWDGNPHSWLGSASCGSRVGHGAELPPHFLSV